MVATLGFVLVRSSSFLPRALMLTGKGVVRGKDVDRAQKIHQSAKAHIGEQNLGRPGALLAGLVDFRGGDGLRKRKFRVFHHDAAEKRDEKNPQRAADHHERDGGPVFIAGQTRPQSRHHEGGDGEDGARRHRLAN